MSSFLNSIPYFCLLFASDFTVILVGCGMGYVIIVVFLKLFLLVLACNWLLMLMMGFQGPSRLVAEEGKSKCAWVTLDDVTNRFIRGKFTRGHIIRIIYLCKSSVLCAVKNHRNPNLLENWWLNLN